MEINPSRQSLPADRKREIDKDLARDEAVGRSPGQGPDTAVDIRLDPERISGFVSTLKSMQPSDLHRVEELRARIADGSYQAEVEELVDPLLDFLDDGRAEV